MTTHNNTSPATGFNARLLHIVAFAQQGATLQGTQPLADLPRLHAECASGTGSATSTNTGSTTVQWQAQGRTVAEAGASPQIWLDLHITTTLPMRCQRCLQGMEQAVQVQRSFRFVRDEASALLLDEEIEEDVLVYSKQFDLLALIEDELLMALPIAPKHDTCPQAPAMHAQSSGFTEEAASKPHPFAALQALKQKPG